MKWITYSSPRIYDTHLRILPKKYLKERNKLISEEIGKNKKVLDLGCGTGFLASFLDNTCIYKGFDINYKFVKACKKKGLDVKQKDIFSLNKEDYRDVDVVIISDVLHHTSKYKILVEKALKHAKEKVIISEPVWAKKMKGNWWLPKIRRKFFYFFDNDGYNKNRSEWFTLDELKEFYKQFGYKKKIVKLGNNLICIFSKNNDLNS